MAAGLTAVLSQRLLRRLCIHCKRRRQIRHADASDFAIDARTQAYYAAGCSNCAGTGYAGRVAIFEGFFVDSPFRTAIASGAGTAQIEEAAAECGYVPMLAHGVQRALAGETSFDEVRRVVVVRAR
jgi:type IV pilus assembly protein PilB